MFDQLRAASEIMKNMSPDQMQQFMNQAEESKHMLEDAVRKLLDEEIRKRGLLTKDEASRLFQAK